MALRLFIIFLLSFLSLSIFAQYRPFTSKQYALAYGQTYRIDDRFYHTFGFSYEKYRSTAESASLNGAGIRFDYFRNDDFAVGIRYFRAMKSQQDYTPLPYWGISPVLFQFNKTIGLNVKPEIGIRINTWFSNPHGLTFTIAYGYDIPIIAENNFNAGRHDLSATISYKRYFESGKVKSQNQSTDKKNKNK